MGQLIRSLMLGLALVSTGAGLPARADISPEILRAFGLRPLDRREGREIAALQTDLLWLGLYRGAIDGVQNTATRTAIRDFQDSLGNRPNGTLSENERETLRNRARNTADGLKIVTRTSDWTGIGMALPMGYLAAPELMEDSPANLIYGGRAAVPFQLMQTRFGGTQRPAQIIGFLEQLLAKRGKAKVVARGTEGNMGYLLMQVDDMQVFSVVQSSGRETRGVSIWILGEAQAALQPVVLTMLESLDLFAGPGVAFDDIPSRLVSGDYPGMDDRPAWYRSMKANGSGSLVSTEGHILTNHHVVSGCDTLTVNGQPARLIGSDVRIDLALIQSDNFANREPITLRSGSPQLGEKVVVIGYPVFSVTQAQNVTDGIISSVFGLEGDLLNLQITAPVQPGNSGGPVLDASGRQIAVVVAKPSESMRQTRNIENVAWVIRADAAIDFLSRYGIRYIPGRAAGDEKTTAEIVAQHRQQALRIECH